MLLALAAKKKQDSFNEVPFEILKYISINSSVDDQFELKTESYSPLSEDLASYSFNIASKAIGGTLTLLLVKPNDIFSFKQRSEFSE